MTRLAAAGLLLLAAVAAASAAVLDALVARIDDSVITWSQVLQEAEIRRVSGEAESLTEVRVVRESLVRRYLLLAEANKLRIAAAPGAGAAAVEQMLAASGDAAGFWERLGRVGIQRGDLERRAEQQAQVQSYLDLRRDMTFVPEADLRGFYLAQRDVLGERSLAEIRDDIRAYLAQRKYQRELDDWIDRQVHDGRVHLLDLPEE